MATSKFDERIMTLFEKVYYFILNLLTFFYDTKILGKLSGTYILCYHSVSHSNWRFSTSPTDFESHLVALKKNFSVVPLQEIFQQKNVPALPLVAITFDDGYQDNFLQAAPILEKYTFPATLFTISDLKNANRDELDNSLKLMSNDELIRLQNEYHWNIQSHSQTHANFGVLDTVSTKKEASESKKELEKILGKKVTSFSYPRGFSSKKFAKILKDSGYKEAYTVDGFKVDKDHVDPYQISRIALEGKLSDQQLLTLLTPVGLYFHAVSMNFLRVKASIMRKVTGS